ncbi:hypothetical protein BHE74_00051222 [Ensete ventricosum]|nr:hypothetical protein BHE74_00051222 [Ensete ventricosum]
MAVHGAEAMEFIAAVAITEQRQYGSLLTIVNSINVHKCTLDPRTNVYRRFCWWGDKPAKGMQWFSNDSVYEHSRFEPIKDGGRPASSCGKPKHRLVSPPVEVPPLIQKTYKLTTHGICKLERSPKGIAQSYHVHMSNKAAAVLVSALAGGGRSDGRRPLPKRGQIKYRIATTAMNSVASALWRVIHCSRILLGNPF